MRSTSKRSFRSAQAFYKVMHIWRNLTSPYRPIDDEWLQRQVQFLARLSLLVSILVAILGLIVLPNAIKPGRPYETIVFWDAVIGVPLFFLGYHCARKERTQVSVLIMTLVSIIGPGAAGLDNFLFAIYMNVGVVFAIAFLETRYKYLSVIINIAILITLDMLLPEMQLSDLMSMIGFTVLLSALLIIFDSMRRQAEEHILQVNQSLEARIAERTRELQNANDEIRRFAYIVSHDLRAPLVNMKGFAAELRLSVAEIHQLLQPLMAQLTPAQSTALEQIGTDIEEALSFIESSTVQMDHFTSAILKLSRLERHELSIEQVNIADIVQNHLNALNFTLEQNNISVKSNDLPTIKTDRVAVEQIFSNIITNAINYLDPDRDGQIEISGYQNEGGIAFTVRDNGRGIAEDDMQKVFEPFRRAGQQTVPGEGMGMAYVRALVRRLGGRIGLESELGVGTTVIFTLPSLNNDDESVKM